MLDRAKSRFHHVLSLFPHYTRGVNLIKIGEPRAFMIKDFWLSGLVRLSDGRLEVRDIWSSDSTSLVTTSEAMNQMQQVLESDFKITINSKIIMSFWCLQSYSPNIDGGTKALLVSDLSSSLLKEITALRLANPFDLRTMRGGGVISKTIIDITSDRVIMLGDAEAVCHFIARTLSRLDLNDQNPRRIAEIIHSLLLSQYPSPVGTHLMLGGFSMIFAIMAGLLINYLYYSDTLGLYGWTAIIFGLLSITYFLGTQAFQDKFIAFSPTWTNKVSVGAWIFFLAILFLTPFLILFQVAPISIIYFISLLSIGLIISNFVNTLGAIYLETGLTRTGLTKRTSLLVWLILASIIIGSLIANDYVMISVLSGVIVGIFLDTTHRSRPRSHQSDQQDDI